MGFLSTRQSSAGLLLAIFLFTGVAGAQSSDVQAARTAVDQSLEQRERPTDAKKTEESDIASRRTALVQILDLATAEIEDLLLDTRLGGASLRTEADISQTAKKLMYVLRQDRAFVDLMRQQVIRPDITGAQLKMVAAALKQWHENVYEPVVKESFDLLLIIQGNDVLVTANRRLEKISTDVTRLQIAAGKAASGLSPLLLAATQALAEAGKNHRDARALFIHEQEVVERQLGASTTAATTIDIRRGEAGEFMCVSGSTTPNHCPVVFRTNRGKYYTLVAADGSRYESAPGEMYQATGTFVQLNPIFSEDLVVGVLFVEGINLASNYPRTPIEAGSNGGTASALDAISSSPDTVRTLIRKELAAVTIAYQKFSAMSKIARQLTGQ